MVVKEKVDYEKALFYAGVLAGLKRAEQLLMEIGRHFPREYMKYFQYVEEAFFTVTQPEKIELMRDLTQCIFEMHEVEKNLIQAAASYYLAKIKKQEAQAKTEK